MAGTTLRTGTAVGTGRWRGRVGLVAVSVGVLAGAGLVGLPGLPVVSAAPATARHTTPPPTVRAWHDRQLGEILVGPRGVTLYHFTRDAPGKPACTRACLAIWPPLFLAKGATEHPGPGVAHLGVLDRPGGKRQVTFDGEPLYYYSGDTKPGQTLGQGIEGLWFVVHPKAARAKATPKPASPTHGYSLAAG